MKPFGIRFDRAVAALHAGGVIAYPTEGVWGLGCDPFDASAVRELLRLKGRSEAKGLILVAAIAELHDAEITLGDHAPGLRVAIVFPKSPAA